MTEMQKLYSECIGLPVIDSHMGSLCGLVRDILVDPENGKIVAFVVKKGQVVIPMDIERVGKVMVISDPEAITPLEEILRVATVAKLQMPILGSKVITEKQKNNLGIAVDFSFDTLHMVLTSLYVSKVFLLFRFQEKILPYQDIVKIEKHKIIVKDNPPVPVIEEKAPAPTTAFAA